MAASMTIITKSNELYKTSIDTNSIKEAVSDYITNKINFDSSRFRLDQQHWDALKNSATSISDKFFVNIANALIISELDKIKWVLNELKYTAS